MYNGSGSGTWLGGGGLGECVDPAMERASSLAVTLLYARVSLLFSACPRPCRAGPTAGRRGSAHDAAPGGVYPTRPAVSQRGYHRRQRPRPVDAPRARAVPPHSGRGGCACCPCCWALRLAVARRRRLLGAPTASWRSRGGGGTQRHRSPPRGRLPVRTVTGNGLLPPPSPPPPPPLAPGSRVDSNSAAAAASAVGLPNTRALLLSVTRRLCPTGPRPVAESRSAAVLRFKCGASTGGGLT